MNKRLVTTTIFLTLLLALASLPAFAGQVEVCHIPNNNPANWHTITVSTNALDAHLDHGDYEGSCASNCEALCDDDNACTQDIASDFDECICNTAPTPVDCDDGNPCTVDGCNAVYGCTYDSDPTEGESCDDGNPDTSGDVCTDGVCAGSCGGADCFTCSDNNPCEDPANRFQMLPHCDKYAFIACGFDDTCRGFFCPIGQYWEVSSNSCNEIP